MRQLIHLWRKFESMWESVSLRIPMNTSSMPLFSVLIGGVRKLSFWKKTPHLPSTQLWILRGQKKCQAIKSRGLQPIILLKLIHLSVARLLLMQQIHPGNPVAPSFFYVDAVVLTWYFSAILVSSVWINLWCMCLGKSLEGTFDAHESLTRNRKMQGEVPSIPSLLKRSVAQPIDS